MEGSGTQRQYGFDAMSRQVTQTLLSSVGAALTVLTDTYDPVSNRTAHVQGSLFTTWTMDREYRLTGMQRSDGFLGTYGFDPAGNVLSKSETGSMPLTMAYDAMNRITTTIQGGLVTTMGYSNAGSLLTENANGAPTTNAYDFEQRLTSVVNPDNSRLSYTYAGDTGLRRSSQATNGALTTFLWSGSDYLGEA